jgi:hypothetical protein
MSPLREEIPRQLLTNNATRVALEIEKQLLPKREELLDSWYKIFLYIIISFDF